MKKIFFIVFFFAMVNSCKKPSSNQPGQQILMGNIQLYGGKVLDDYKGTIIRVENSNPEITTLTKSDGSFELPVNGIKDDIILNISHTGFGTIVKKVSKEELENQLNDGSAFTEFLYARSEVTVNSLSGTIEGKDLRLKCNVTLTDPTAENAVRFFMKKNSDNISYDNCTSYKDATRPQIVVNGENIITMCLPCMKDCGYLPGDTVFLKTYGDATQLSSFIHPVTNQIIFPCVNPNSNSNIVKFIIP